ncbi:HEPN domain-containing protein [Paenarthrobacter sp. NPDC089989]|uniref:HEPN domain-containing protein n=1 Tax=unclassified Paenarthrobacter TaxID=2634190 RepID=UPI003809C921
MTDDVVSEDRTASGVFWVQGGNEVAGAVEFADEGYALRLSGFCFPPKQVEILDGGAIRYGSAPDQIAADFAARVILGRLDDESLVTLLDAHMQPGPDVTSSYAQFFTGKRWLHGAHISGDDEEIHGIRWSWPVLASAVSWTTEAEVPGPVPGQLAPWVHEQKAGLTFKPGNPSPVGVLIQDVQVVAAQLLGLWTQKPVPSPLVTEIYLEAHGWCSYVPEQEKEQKLLRSSALLPLRKLGLKEMASWLALAAKVDPFPYIANFGPSVVQVDAQVLVTALEGLHRRLHSEVRPFHEVSVRGVQRAMKAAREAGIRGLVTEGLTDESIADKVLRDALSYVDQPSYHSRIVELVSPVMEVAPGVCGPELNSWLGIVKKIRNEQSHQLLGAFGSAELGNYFVATISCKWVLVLRILLEIVSPKDLKEAVTRSQSYIYALANMDEEHIWGEPGALGTFSAAGSDSDDDNENRIN